MINILIKLHAQNRWMFTFFIKKKKQKHLPARRADYHADNNNIDQQNDQAMKFLFQLRPHFVAIGGSKIDLWRFQTK